MIPEAQLRPISVPPTPPRCDDAMKNGDEWGTDCGGSCLRKCSELAMAAAAAAAGGMAAREFGVHAGRQSAENFHALFLEQAEVEREAREGCARGRRRGGQGGG